MNIKNHTRNINHFESCGTGITLMIFAKPSSDFVLVFILSQVKGGKYKYEIVICSLGTKTGIKISPESSGLRSIECLIGGYMLIFKGKTLWTSLTFLADFLPALRTITLWAKTGVFCSSLSLKTETCPIKEISFDFSSAKYLISEPRMSVMIGDISLRICSIVIAPPFLENYLDGKMPISFNKFMCPS